MHTSAEMMEEERLLRPIEAASLLSIGQTTLRQLMLAGELVPVRIGRGRGVKRYRRSDIRAYIDSRQQPPPNRPGRPRSAGR